MRAFLCAAFFAKKAAGPGFLCFAVRRGGEAAVSPRLSGGVKTPPYGKREHGSSDRRSQQDKIARAACRPPLRPNGNSQFSIFVRNLRKVVGRGRTPPQERPGRRGVFNKPRFFLRQRGFNIGRSPQGPVFPGFPPGIFGGLSVFLTIFPRFAQGFPHFQQSFPHFPRGKGGGYGGKPGANGAKPMVFPGFFLSVKNSSQQVHLLGP